MDEGVILQKYDREDYPSGYLNSTSMLKHILAIYDNGKGFITLEGISLRFKYIEEADEFEVRFCAFPGTTSGVEYWIPHYRMDPKLNSLLLNAGITKYPYYKYENNLSSKALKKFIILMDRHQRLDNLLS